MEAASDGVSGRTVPLPPARYESGREPRARPPPALRRPSHSGRVVRPSARGSRVCARWRVSAVAHLHPATEHLLTKQQLAAHLGRSPRWIELRVKEGMPSTDPTVRYPQRRFRLSDVE